MGRSGGVANVRGEVAFVAQQVLGDVDVDVDVDVENALCPPLAPKLFT